MNKELRNAELQRQNDKWRSLTEEQSLPKQLKAFALAFIVTGLLVIGMSCIGVKALMWIFS